MAKLNNSWRLFNGGISKCIGDSTASAAWKRFTAQFDKKAKAEAEAKNWAAYLERRKLESEGAVKAKKPEIDKAAEACVVTASMKTGYMKSVDFGVKIMSNSMWVFVGTSLTFLGHVWAVNETYKWLTNNTEKEKRKTEKEKQELKEKVSKANGESKKKTLEMVMKQHQVTMSEWQTWKKESEERMMRILIAAMTSSDAPTTDAAARWRTVGLLVSFVYHDDDDVYLWMLEHMEYGS